MFKSHALTTLPAAQLGLDTNLLDRLASQTKFIVRNTSGFSASGFLLSCLKAVGTGKASFRALARNLAQSEPKQLSRQAIHYRSNQFGVLFFRAIAGNLTERLMSNANIGCFKRILLQDSTQLRMHPGNVSHYRAVSNNPGPTSGARFDYISELSSGGLLSIELTEGYTQDKSTGPRLLELVRPGDLVLRDMGYFDIKGFKAIESCAAHWISRLHGMATVTLPSGKPLEKILQSNTRDTIDIEGVMVTTKGHRCRLVAIRTPEPVAARRRAVKRHKRKLNKTNPNKRSLIREGWTIYLTNLPAVNWSSEKIHILYSQRWAIEIRFRALKSNTEMKRALNRKTNKHHLEILLLSALIQSLLCALQHQFMLCSKNPRAGEVSLELVAAWLKTAILAMRDICEPIRYDLRHLIPEKRKRKTLRQKLISLF